MKIGELSKQTKCKIETIRYYEKIGLMYEPARTEGGYRLYSDEQLKRLVFIRRSRELGFTIEQIRALLALVDGEKVSCADVNEIAKRHIRDIKQKIQDLKKLEKSLSHIASQCSGETVPDCPIIDALFEMKK